MINDYFNPRAPCGARLFFFTSKRACSSVFQPTRPLRGATVDQNLHDVRYKLFQPTRPLRGATGNAHSHYSIGNLFQPTRPLRGATKSFRSLDTGQIFQPTRPLRGATCALRNDGKSFRYFNPRAPCGARRFDALNICGGYFPISTHAPLAGRDVKLTGTPESSFSRFQPTRPLRGATCGSAVCYG